MRELLFALLGLLLLGSGRPALATTWNEPWHEKVVKEADLLVLATVVASDATAGITATIIRPLAGGAVTGTIKITGFYLLRVCSTYGNHGPEFPLAKSDTCYFFLKKNERGSYSIATPTTGFAVVAKGQVYATYRHSYHQALVPPAVYEPTMTAIFQKYHGLPYDSAYVEGFVAKYLALAPAKIEEGEMTVFFLQHVALETMHHLGLTTNYSLVLPFLHDTRNMHAQIAAARALAGIATPAAKQQLLALLEDAATQDFLKVVAVWTLASYQPRELKTTLLALEKNASAEPNDFGGNIMDPRVCTSVPSVKAALAKLTAAL